MVLWIQRREADAARSAWESVAIPRANAEDTPEQVGITLADGAAVIGPLQDDATGKGCDLVARLVPFARYGVRRVALVAASPVARTGAAPILVNGFPPMGVVTLEDRDEIVVPGALMLFAANAAEQVRDYAQGEAHPACARCHLALAAGDRVLSCSGCGAPSHEGPLAPEPAGRPAELACASYDLHCGACRRASDELVWHPEGLVGGVVEVVRDV